MALLNFIGGYMTSIIDNLLYPNKVLEDNKQELIDLYIEDYTEKNEKLIRKRINNTLYLFDSNPIDMYNYLQNKQIHDYLKERQIEKEYEDYIRINNKYNNIYTKKYLDILAKYFYEIKTTNINVLLDLDYSSFNYENKSIINNSNNEEEKKIILLRQKDYLSKCREVNVNPICDSLIISIIENEKERLQSLLKTQLILNTKWGRRIIKTVKRYNKNISTEEIIKIINNEVVATTNIFTDKKISKVVYLPLITRMKYNSLDRFFYHENRHVIESSKYNNGLYNFKNNRYQLINEIRTEINAISDSKKRYNKVLWNNKELTKDYYSKYEVLIPYTYDFFNTYKSLLNDLAITGNINDFENYFDSNNLVLFDNYLKSLLKLIKYNEEEVLIKRKEEGKQLVKRMNNNYQK